MKVTPGIIEEFGGKFISRGGTTICLEGPKVTHRMISVEFPNLERARAFYDSEIYTEARKLRAGAAAVELIVIDRI